MEKHFFYTHKYFRKKKCKQSLESKTKQKKQFKIGLTALIKDLKEENKCLHNKVRVEKAAKEKYFEMWRISEKEKGKIKNARLVSRELIIK